MILGDSRRREMAPCRNGVTCDDCEVIHVLLLGPLEIPIELSVETDLLGDHRMLRDSIKRLCTVTIIMNNFIYSSSFLPRMLCEPHG